MDIQPLFTADQHSAEPDHEFVMTTILNGIDDPYGALRTALSILMRGLPVIFPTETVYGIGAHAFNPQAVRRVFDAKSRPLNNPMTIHLAHPNDVVAYARDIPPLYYTLARAFMPGPLTSIIRRSQYVPDIVTAGGSSVGIRVPDHDFALALLERSGGLVGSSANIAGKPAPSSAGEALEQLGGRVPAMVDCGPARHGLASTIVDLTSEPPRILREGVITREMLEEVGDCEFRV